MAMKAKHLLLLLSLILNFLLTKAQNPWLSVAGGVAAGGGGIPVHGNVSGAQDQVAITTTTVRDGIIYAWRDNRTGSNGRDIYAQKLDPCGNVVTGWPADGVLICNAAGNQDNIQILEDGSDGAIIIWEDDRNGGAQQDIYAQKIAGNGVVAWTANGVVITAAGNSQGSFSACEDGVGGAFVVWDDNRPGSIGTKDLYAQRITSSGTIAAGWTVNGTAVSVETQNQVDPHIVSDGSGGAIIVWEDNRTGSNGVDIYGQRVTANAAMLWTVNGIVISNMSNGQNEPKIVNIDNTSFLVAFTNSDNVIYGKKIDLTGTTIAPWNVLGDIIANPGGTTGPLYDDIRGITVTGSGYAYLPYSRTDGIDQGIYSYQIPLVNPPLSSTDISYNPWGREDVSRVNTDVVYGDTALTVYRQGNASFSPTPGIYGIRNTGSPGTSSGTKFLISSSGTSADFPDISAIANNFYFAWEDNRPSAVGLDIYAATLDTLAAPAQLAVSAGPYCFGDNITFTTLQPAGLFNSYEFFVDGISVQSGASNVFNTSTLSMGAHVITVTAGTASGCATRSSNIINLTIINCVLPIELLSFDAEREKDKVRLEWVTSSEVNNAFYTIEKSYDIESWKIIGKIDGAGNSNSVINYKHFDNNLKEGINYYRLKQTDFDGKYSYSDIKSIDYDAYNNPVKIYPNPTNGQLIIAFNRNPDIETNIMVTDVMGNIVYNRMVNDNKVFCDLSAYAQGVYLVEIKTERKTERFKIIKQ